jgi:hypothetical protein
VWGLQDKLEVKKSEVESVVAKRALVFAEFESALPEGEGFRDPLTKIFQRCCTPTNDDEMHESRSDASTW